MYDLINLVVSYFGLLIDFVLNIDDHLATLSAQLGPWLYVVLFAIIFCETGLVVTPILPGDSLLFAAGAVAALESAQINIVLLTILLIIAGILGDAVNYSVGRYFGARAKSWPDRWYFKKAHLESTSKFYQKHGGKTIIIARFLPIIRTFAPFVAGAAEMNYSRFAAFNITGAVLWVGLFLPAGYFFGNLPAVQRNFHVVIFGIIIVSALPAVFQAISVWRESRIPSNA